MLRGMRFRALGWRRNRLLLLLTVVLLLVYLVHIILNIVSHDSKKPKHVLCEQSLETKAKMSQVLAKAKAALEALKVSFFLCYQSLWGALRGLKGPLPWEGSLEICLLNEEVSKVEEAYLMRTFRQKGLTIGYSSTDGVYTVHDAEDSEAQVQLFLFLFEEDSMTNQMRRVGWKHRIIPSESCQMIHCFPPRLVEKPLPTSKFLDLEVPVPREEIELQKYLFPETWWKDLEPEECRS